MLIIMFSLICLQQATNEF